MRSTTLLLAAVLAAAAFPVTAQVSVNINVGGDVVRRAPPPPRHERMPGLRAGHVWVPGHWQWTGRDYRWMRGHYQAARPDYAYAPGAWVRVDDGWRWREGDWRRAERRAERRHDRHDRHHRHDDRGHCPPGQAKKGNC